MAEEIRHPEVRFEPTDANFGWIVSILIGAIVFLVIIHLAVLAFFHGFRDHLAEVNRSPFPLAPGPATDAPPQSHWKHYSGVGLKNDAIALPSKPRLEQIDRLSGAKESNLFLRESAKLRKRDSYGPTESPEHIHVPIERAMQVLIDKNLLKARPEPPAAQLQRAGGLVDAGEPNSGRLLKGGAK